MSAHRRLREAILDLDPVYPRLYETSAEFHATIDTLVRVLVPITRMIADDALRADQERSHAQALLTETLQNPLPDAWGITARDVRGPAPGWKPEPRQ